MAVFRSAGSCILTALKERSIDGIGTVLVGTARVKEAISGESGEIPTACLENIIPEFVGVLQYSQGERAPVPFGEEIDDMLLTLVENSGGDSLDALEAVEHEARRRYCEHERRVWGELEPATLKKFE